MQVSLVQILEISTLFFFILSISTIKNLRAYFIDGCALVLKPRDWEKKGANFAYFEKYY